MPNNNGYGICAGIDSINDHDTTKHSRYVHYPIASPLYNSKLYVLPLGGKLLLARFVGDVATLLGLLGVSWVPVETTSLVSICALVVPGFIIVGYFSS
jgi:hypothetical protein